jgi:hypothetical protein
MIWWIIGIIAYLAIACFTYFKFTSKWESHTKLGQIYFSAVWILILPLFIIHWLHNKK